MPEKGEERELEVSRKWPRFQDRTGGFTVVAERTGGFAGVFDRPYIHFLGHDLNVCENTNDVFDDLFMKHGKVIFISIEQIKSHPLLRLMMMLKVYRVSSSGASDLLFLLKYCIEMCIIEVDGSEVPLGHTIYRLCREGGTAHMRFQPRIGQLLAAASDKVVFVFDV